MSYEDKSLNDVCIGIIMQVVLIELRLKRQMLS